MDRIFTINETASARELNKAGSGRYIWVPCPECEQSRWLRTDKENVRCLSCARKVVAKKRYKDELAYILPKPTKIVLTPTYYKNCKHFMIRDIDGESCLYCGYVKYE